MILHIWKPKALITAKQPGPGGSSLRCDFFFRRVCSRRAPGGAVYGCFSFQPPRFAQQSGHGLPARLAEPAGDWVAGVREVAPGSAELA